MTDIAIRVDKLGKQYHIGQRRRSNSMRETFVHALQSPFRWFRSVGNCPANNENTFWALKDVSFEVKQGEVVGIIGRNGAGKSTLLKILSRITEPTTGEVEITGRVGSLLEVGTGFHPELTGRENVYLNGAILGMRKPEIKRKFDEIVAFAEVEKFLDTQVKHYSSGMYMRLAFAVAAHLDPEILVVDEVLAVGDAQFQKRCLGRMQAVANSGRTVLFVSHNLNAVESLCTHALLLERGNLRERGSDVRGAIIRYLSSAGNEEGVSSSWVNRDNSFNHPAMQPVSFAIVNAQGQPPSAPVRNDEALTVVVRADVRQRDPALNMGFALFNQDSELLLWSLTTDGPENQWPKLDAGPVEFRCALPTRFLNEGAYRLELIASLHCRDWFIRPGHNSPAIHFEIKGGLSDSPYWLFARPGILAPEWKWERAG